MKLSWSGLPAGWKELWQRYKYVLLVVLAGVILLVLPGGETGGKKQALPQQLDGQFDVEAVERKLERALSQISGAGEVTVVLTLKESSRQVLARDTQVSEKEQRAETVILSTGAGTEGTVPLQSIYPKYQGALVVCAGGGDARVKLELLEAVRALTGLSAEKISICKRQ